MAIVIEGSWTDRSLDWISRMREQNKGLTTKEIERLCRKNYPYDQRKGWAYKAWLKAMRISSRGQAAGVKRIPVHCPNTPDLFDGVATT